ncbi:MAG: DUF4349 domain-containing protein [Spirochaetaceae bacterium]|jgi:hypothetical protein|nr:DUF4349 domain-containing protein [Spirochaetaceae bacterium]
MKKILLSIFSLMMLISLNAQDNWLSYNLDCQVLTEDGTSFSRDIISWAEDHGGYYTEMSPQRVILRFPWQDLPTFREWLNLNSREIYRLDQSSQDLREEILGLQSGLEARQEILDKNLEYLDKSNFQGTLALEQEIRRLMGEIDQRKGQLRRLRNDKSMVKAVVNTSFLSNSLPDRGYSSFPWINGVDYYDFTDNRFPQRERKIVRFPLPQGFALERKGWIWKALTPEGIALQLRWVENYPEMTVDFWKNALVEDFKNRGYTWLSEPKTINPESENPMVLTEWGIPYGQEDHQYICGIMVQNDKILILEFGGPILLLQQHETAVMEAIEEFLN